MRHLRFGLWTPWSMEESFDYFTDVYTLDRVTPPWFRLRPQASAVVELGSGARIDYAMKWRGLPMKWQSVIRDWDPPYSMSYEQGRGPFRYYRHEHRFRPKRGGTALDEYLAFDVPVGTWVGRLLVEPDLARIFGFRQSTVEKEALRRLV